MLVQIADKTDPKDIEREIQKADLDLLSKLNKIGSPVANTAAWFTRFNPKLLAGQIGFELDTLYFKIGDGSTAYNSLTYYFQSGSNANGTWIKHADGTMIQWGTKSCNNSDNTNTGTTVTFPLAFNAAPPVVIASNQDTSVANFVVWVVSSIIAASCRIRVVTPALGVATAVMAWVAYGRWK
jgi:hypothetical protein